MIANEVSKFYGIKCFPKQLLSAIERNEALVSYTTDESWKHDAQWKNPYTKGGIIWFYLYEMSKISKSLETEPQLDIAKGGGGGHGNCWWAWVVLLGVMKMF